MVGEHILPGTYVTSAQDGCYWERLSEFSGSFGGVISNEFVSSAGQRFATIEATDVGFTSDAECGTWLRM